MMCSYGRQADARTYPRIRGWMSLPILARAPGLLQRCGPAGRRPRAPLVGRQSQLHLLDDALAHVVRESSCSLFTVLGTAGVGKSRLTAEFLRDIDARVLAGRCLSYGQGITYLPLVLVPEGGPHMMALGERTCPEQPKKPGVRTPLTFVADESTFFHRILTEQKSVLIADTDTEEKWRTFKGHKQLRSWLSAPLVASESISGAFSVGHTQPNVYTQDHLRRAELLAIPAAAAIQNARLYETASIYGETF